MIRRSKLLALFVAAVLVFTVPAVADDEATISGIAPTDIDLGETSQLISLGGSVPSGESTLEIDLTPLADAGVDMSAATVEVNRSRPDLQVDSRIERTDSGAFLRAAINATEATSYRLRFRLENLSTSDAVQTWVRYEASIGEASTDSNRFRIEPAGMPDLVADPESDGLIVDQPDEQQRIRLTVFDAPQETPVSISLQTTSLRDAGVSIASLSPETSIADGDAVVNRVGMNGTNIVIDARTGNSEQSSIILELSGLDTREAVSTTDIRYSVSIEAPVGTKTIQSLPFGLYRPGEAPTPTETIVESPTETETATDTQSGTDSPTSTASPTTGASGPSGFTAVIAGLGVLLAAVVLARRL